MDDSMRVELIEQAAILPVEAGETPSLLLDRPVPAAVDHRGWVEVIFNGQPAWTNAHILDVFKPDRDGNDLLRPDEGDPLLQRAGADVSALIHADTSLPMEMVGIRRLLDEDVRDRKEYPGLVYFGIGDDHPEHRHKQPVAALQLAYVQQFLSRYADAVSFRINERGTIVNVYHGDQKSPVGVIVPFQQDISHRLDLDVALGLGDAARKALQREAEIKADLQGKASQFDFDPYYSRRMTGDHPFKTKKAAQDHAEQLKQEPEEDRNFIVVPRYDRREWFVRADKGGLLTHKNENGKTDMYFVQDVGRGVLRLPYYSNAYPAGRHREFDSMDELKAWITSGGIAAENEQFFRRQAEEQQGEERERLALGGPTIAEALEKAMDSTKETVRRAANRGDVEAESQARQTLRQQRQTVFDVEEALKAGIASGTLHAVDLPECFTLVKKLIESVAIRMVAVDSDVNVVKSGEGMWFWNSAFWNVVSGEEWPTQEEARIDAAEYLARRRDEELVLLSVGFTLKSTGRGWYALLPGETEFRDDDSAGKHDQNYLGFFVRKGDMLDELVDDIVDRLGLSDAEWDSLPIDQKCEKANQVFEQKNTSTDTEMAEPAPQCNGLPSQYQLRRDQGHPVEGTGWTMWEPIGGGKVYLVDQYADRHVVFTAEPGSGTDLVRQRALACQYAENHHSLSSAARQFAQTVEALLQKHYGLTLNDTPYSSGRTIQQCLDASTRPFEAVNEHAYECDLSRVDVTWSRPLTLNDQMVVMAASASEQYQLYKTAIENGEASQGMMEYLAMDERLNDGEAEILADLAKQQASTVPSTARAAARRRIDGPGF